MHVGIILLKLTCTKKKIQKLQMEKHLPFFIGLPIKWNFC